MALIALFDIDGTLVSTGGAGRRTIRAGLAEVTGRSSEELDPGFSFAGMTDRSIMRRALEEFGHAVDDDRIDAALEAYLEVLGREVERAADYRVFPGVRGLLDDLIGRQEVAVGLGTGNARRGAAIKLSRGGLDDYFGFGGFGCEFEARPKVVRAGIERGARRLGRDPADCRVVVIGDTPADVEAARANDASCLVVSTGSVGRERLVECGPAWCVDSLEEGVVREVLLS